MQDNNFGKGNMLVSYIFPDNTSVTKNIDNEFKMKQEFLDLVESWKQNGYIGHYVIADDECISEKLKGN